ncbi:MAG: hypothetical protein VXW79_01070, partial [Bacteroidota bacterium]|nr:hypothetical protein [Bacteroidota bacterium]
LRCKGDENWISVYSGGLSSNTDTTKVSALLQRSNLEFQEIEQDGQGDSSRMASLLWREAEAHVPVSFEIQLDKRCIETINGKRLLDELPLSEQTRRVLDQSKPHCSTTELLSELDVPATAGVRQLGALRALGLIRLGPIATRPQLGRRNKRTASEAGRRNTRQASARVRSHPAATPDPALVLRRLKSEFERLKHADPHTILGLPRDCGADLLHGATQRMESRYSLQSRDPDLPKEARKIAAQLARMVVEAETSILSADAKPRSARTAAPPSPAPQNAAPSLEELAFSEGTKAFAAGDFKRATQCFRKARDEKIDSVRNLAWLGWAVFHHPNMPEDERIEESTDLLRLAVSFDPRNRQAQFFLAYIESKVGQAESAIKRLESVVRMHPDHREAKRLLHMLVSKAS